MFCNKLRKKIKDFTAKVSSQLIEYADVAIGITTVLKNALKNPIADLVTGIIPGQWDDVLKANLIYAIEYAIEWLEVAKEIVKKHLSLQQKMELVHEHLKNLPEALQESFLIKMAALITRHLDSSEQKQHVYDALVQLNYSVNK